LLASFRERRLGMIDALNSARSAGAPVVYVNNQQVTILAEACATNDPELEELALRYAEQVAGMRVIHN